MPPKKVQIYMSPAIVNRACTFTRVEDIPVPLAQGMQAKLVCDFSSIHGIGKILFVCKDQQHCITQLILPTYDNLGVIKRCLKTNFLKLQKLSILMDTKFTRYNHHVSWRHTYQML